MACLRENHPQRSQGILTKGSGFGFTPKGKKQGGGPISLGDKSLVPKPDRVHHMPQNYVKIKMYRLRVPEDR